MDQTDTAPPLSQQVDPNAAADTIPSSQGADSDRENHEHFRRLVELTAAVPYTRDVVREQFVYVGPQAERIFGYALQTWTDRGFWHSHIHPDDRAATIASLQSRGPDATEWHGEYRFVTAQGQTIWVRDSMAFRDSTSGPMAYGVLVDVTDRHVAAADLTESRAMLRSLVDAIPATITIKDLTGRYVLVNKAFAQTRNLPIDAIVGRRTRDLFPDGAARIESRDRTAAISETALTPYETSRRDNNGHRTVWLASKAPLRDARGNVTHVAGIAFDISDRKRAEEALKASEAKYRAIVEDQTEMIIRFLPDSTLTFVNSAVCRYYGVPPEALIGVSFLVNVPEKDRAALVAHFAGLNRDNPVAMIEHRVTRPGEPLRWQSWTDRAIFDSNGTVIEYQSVGRDITDKKLAEEQLRESEQRLRHLVESTNVVPYTWDVKTERYLYVGPQTQDLFGYPPEHWTASESWLSIVHPEDREAVRKTWEAQQKESQRGYVEYRIVKPDESIAWVRDTARLDRQDDGEIFCCGVMIDVTESKKREEQLIHVQKMDMIGQMTGGIAHDFNNLLTVIIANLHMLESAVGDDPAAKRRLGLVKNAANHGAELTQGLLAFARRQSLEPKQTDVNALVSGMSELLSRTLGEAIRIDLALAPDLSPAEVDPAQLESALVNLAVNARDAMPTGGDLRIETGNRLFEIDPGQSRRFVMLTVKDTGCGMSPEVLKKVFEPFFTTKAVNKGTGLGLSMVYGFAKQSGGRVEIASTPGEGTAVSIFLPVNAPSAAVEPNAAPPATAPAAGRTVLVVDGAADVRATLVGMLERLGYRAFEANGGAAALSILEQHDSIDLVLTDLIIPGNMSGVVLAYEASRRWPRLKMLFSSAQAKTATGPGPQWLSKPYDADEVAAKVAAALGGGQS